MTAGKAISFISLISLLLLIAVDGQQVITLCEGNFCPANFTAQVNSTTSQCGVKYSDIFTEPNITQNSGPLGNFTYTNNSDVVDITMYLSEVLQGKAYELYSEQKALVDGAASCQSSTFKTEFASTRLNSSQCTIDIDDVVSSITPILEEKWLQIHYGKSSLHPAKSCKDLFESNPSLPSGTYWLMGSGGNTVQAYCDMEGTNCDGLGGWMRLYKLDFEGTDSTFHTCPSSTSFETYTYTYLGNDILMCRRKGNVNGCKSATFNANGISYGQVCGKAKGYQRGTTDAFYRGNGAANNDIDDNYVDGISFTYGSGPRKHIFTLAAGCSETSSCWVQSRCPCQSGQNPPVPKFIGHDDFYCEAGSYWHPQGGVWYNEPLWDALNCDYKEAPCCSVTANIPWFYRVLGLSTNDNVEMRVCTDEYSNGEDVGFSQLELYVK